MPLTPETAVITLRLETMEAVWRALTRLHIGNIPAKDRPLILEAEAELKAVREMVGRSLGSD